MPSPLETAASPTSNANFDIRTLDDAGKEAVLEGYRSALAEVLPILEQLTTRLIRVNASIEGGDADPQAGG